MILTALQKRMVELLAELDEFLRSNGIEYMLYCGSQLGADRHGGIIPWDDDVDIMMSLDNYDKFIELAKTKLPEGRVVNAMELSEDYPLCYARYVDITTTALQKHTVFGNMDPGVKVDVFFCVPTSSNPKKAHQHQMEILAFNELMIDNIVMVYRRPEDFFPVYEKEKKLFEKLGRREYMRKRLPELKYKYKSHFIKPKKYIFFSAMAGNSHFFDANELTNAHEIDFDGYKVMGAVNGEYYNLESYDESWYQVPENVSSPHHIWAADLSTPCSDHLIKYRNYFNLEEILNAMRERKQVRLEEQVKYKDAIITAAKLKNLSIGMSVEKHFSELSEPDSATLDKVFSPLYKRQLNRENRWYHLRVPVSDKVLSLALLNLARMGEFAKVINFIDAAGESGISCLDEIHRHIEVSRKLIYAIYVYPDTLDDTLNKILNSSLCETAKENLSLYEAEGRVLLNKMRASEGSARIRAAEEICSFVRENTKKFGSRPELLILEAYAIKELEKQGHGTCEDSGSHDIFSDVLKRTTNGFIIQEVLNEGLGLPDSETPSGDGFAESGTVPGNRLIHYYVNKDRFEKLKTELEEKTAAENYLGLVIKGSGDKQRIVLYDKRYLAATFMGIIDNRIDQMAYRSIWHISEDGSEKTEYRSIPIFADNVTPEEFILRAREDVILTEESIAFYKEYRKWIKQRFAKASSILENYSKEFLDYMDKVNGSTKNLI